MTQTIHPTLFFVGIKQRPQRAGALDVYTATTSREALATMRLIDFDLLVAGLENPKLDVWDLMQRILAIWPQQRWILASERITAEEEVLARSLGAMIVLHALPSDEWLSEFTASLRRRDLWRTVRPPVSANVPAPLTRSAGRKPRRRTLPH